MGWIKAMIGCVSAMSYGYLKWNQEGLWYVIPFIILCIILFTDN